MFIGTNASFKATVLDAKPASAEDLLGLHGHLENAQRAVPNYGLLAGTMVETLKGWAPVQTVQVGDSVQTYDGAMRDVLRVERSFVPASKMGGLIEMEGGAVPGSGYTLLPGNQPILSFDKNMEDTRSSPFVLTPARALLGQAGVRRAEDDEVLELVTLSFEDEELIYTNGEFCIQCPAAKRAVSGLTAPVGSEFWPLRDTEVLLLVNRVA